MHLLLRGINNVHQVLDGPISSNIDKRRDLPDALDSLPGNIIVDILPVFMKLTKNDISILLRNKLR